MKWNECQLITLQKMFEAEGEIPQDAQEFISRMPGVANECMVKMIQVKPLLKKHAIDISPNPNNLIQNGNGEHLSTDISFKANGKSLYIEVKDRYEVVIRTTTGVTVNDEIIEGYSPVYKYFKRTYDCDSIEIIFAGDYPYSFKNVAIFEYKYFQESEVPNFGVERKYDLRELPDFFRFNLVSNNQSPRQEGDSVIVFDYYDSGYYEFYYEAYPNYFTAITPDDEVIQLDDELCVLMPIYMAGQLMKDDDIQLAIQYLNEFEQALMLIRSNIKPMVEIVQL